MRLNLTVGETSRLTVMICRNIDNLEERAGLSYGLGDKTLPLPPRRSKGMSRTNSQCSIPYPSPAPSPPPHQTLHSTIPQCIPLHGQLSTLTCPSCKQTFETNQFLPILQSGTSPGCPNCLQIESDRISLGERSRGVGRLRPDVVLYGEEHRDGERIGSITQRDLMGQRPDLLLVVGTSLKVPGTKRLVRELSKVIRPLPKEDLDDDTPPPASGSSVGSNASQGVRGKKIKMKPIHTVYLNYDFPSVKSEWKDVFDVWARGDVQQFVQELKMERERMNNAGGVEVEKKMARRGSGAGLKGKGKATVTAQPKTTTKGKSTKTLSTKPSAKTKTIGGAAKPRQTLNSIKSEPASTGRTTRNSQSTFSVEVPVTKSRKCRTKTTSTSIQSLGFSVTKSSVGNITGTTKRNR